MVTRFFIGDKVRTKNGIGIVRKVTTWRDCIVEMSDAEAEEFCALAKMQVGINFRKDWVELLISTNLGLLEVQAKKVELLEGRDYGKSEGLETAFT